MAPSTAVLGPETMVLASGLDQMELLSHRAVPCSLWFEEEGISQLLWDFNSELINHLLSSMKEFTHALFLMRMAFRELSILESFIMVSGVCGLYMLYICLAIKYYVFLTLTDVISMQLLLLLESQVLQILCWF